METQKPYMIMILLQFISSGNALLSKAALSGGMNGLVFSFYKQAIATLFLAPFAIFFERKIAPPFSFKTQAKIFLFSLFAITSSLVLYIVALEYTSATLSVAINNALPVVTFVIALLFRMEIVNLRSSSGRAKVLGVAACVAGIVILALYKGPALKFLNQHHAIYKEKSNSNHFDGKSSKTWILGSILMLISVVIWAMWFIFQGPVLEIYPSKLKLTILQSFYSTIQVAVIAAIYERNLSKWKLGLDIQLLSVAYCGIFVNGVTFWSQAWSIEKKGPVFTAMFRPLTLLITIGLSGLILGEQITWGSVLGGVLMVIGLYSVLWGKSKEPVDSKPTDEQEKWGNSNEDVESKQLEEHEKEFPEVQVTS